MAFVAIYLYLAGMPIAVHLADNVARNMKPKDRLRVALLWPSLLPIYALGILSSIWGRS